MKGGTIVLLLASVAIAFAHEATQLPAAASADDHNEDFDKIDDRLDRLTARLIGIEEKIEARTDPARIQRARSLKARVEKIEGSDCGKREYQCGGADPQCVGLLLVCDGIKDCRNGEDEKHCDLPMQVGDVYQGRMIFDKCTKRQPDEIDFEITSIRTSTTFNSFIKVTANMEIDYEDDKVAGHVSFPVVGFYSHGAKKIVFQPPEDDRLYLVCEFDGSNPDRCVGKIKRESGEECAKLLYTKKKDDDHDHDDDHHQGDHHGDDHHHGAGHHH